MAQNVKPIHITDFLAQRANGVVIDVRTPAEYEKGHMLESYNVPLFSNEERVLVGTTYKQTGREEAILQGLTFVGPRMAEMVRQVKAIANDKPVFIYCWRGGMRSGSVAWLLQTAGMQVCQLVGGYKTYRNHFHQLVQSQAWQLTVLGGRTGSGKTEILSQLTAKGQQTIDLEALACHKGSAYGALGQQPQPSTEHFENLLHEKFLTFDPTRPIWVEGESQRIGTCFIPMELFALMQSSLYINIIVPTPMRVDRLVQEYAHFPKAQLAESTNKIKKRLGGLMAQQTLDAIAAGDFHKVAQLTLAYYDKTYDFCVTERISAQKSVEFTGDNASEFADYLINEVADDA